MMERCERFDYFSSALAAFVRRDKDGRFWIEVHLDVRVMTKNHIDIGGRPVMVKERQLHKVSVFSIPLQG